VLIKASGDTEQQLGAYAWEIRGDQSRNLVVGIDRKGAWVLSLLTEARDGERQTGRLTFAGNPTPFTYELNLKNGELLPGDARYEGFIGTVKLYQRDLDAHQVLRQYDNDVLKCAACTLGAIGCAGNVIPCPAKMRQGEIDCAMRSVAACGGAMIACGLCVVAVPPPDSPPSPLPFGPVTPTGHTPTSGPTPPAVIQHVNNPPPPPPTVCEEKDSDGHVTKCWCEDPDHAENDPDCTND
jgi:hypothetical protein